jgi:integrase
VLAETEARQLLKVAEGSLWYAVWWIMLAVGLRSGEVRGLRWADYDADTRSLRVRRSVKTPKKVGATKGKRERWVPLPGPCVVAIEAHRDLLKHDLGIPLRGRRKGSPSVIGSPWMFPSHVTGRPYPSNTLWYHLRQTIEAANLPRIRPHDLRHSSATFMIARGEALPLVAEILGHRSSAFTSSRYGHVLTGQYRQVAQTMADVLSEPPAPASKRPRRVQKAAETG